jgi:hypothetical protein
VKKQNAIENGLFVCFSENWGTQERRVLKDCIEYRNSGHIPILYCLKDSPLDLKGQDEEIPSLYYMGKDASKFFSFHNFFEFKKVIISYRINLVHIFGKDSIWLFGFLLKQYPLIPFFISIFREFKHAYDNFYHAFLFNRVDRVFVPSEELKQNVFSFLSLKPTKVVVSGLGIEANVKKISNDLAINEQLNLSHNSLIVGIPCHLDVNSWPSIETIVFALGSLLEMRTLKKTSSSSLQLQLQKDPLYFVFISEFNWEESLFLGKIRDYVLTVIPLEKVRFLTLDLFEGHQKLFNLWLIPDYQECLPDHMLTALRDQVPIVIPRGPSGKEILGLEPLMGKSYESSDARELRIKLLELIDDLKAANSIIKKVKARILAPHMHEYYVKTMRQEYQLAFSKRERFYSVHSGTG